MFCSIKSYNTCSNAVFPTIVLRLVYCAADDTLFEFSQEIRCSDASSRRCRYGNHTHSLTHCCA